jgi:hypothetical protein
MQRAGSSDGAGGGRRDRQQDGPNARGRVASKERAVTSVRRAGGEATVWALGSALNVHTCKPNESSAQTVASATARFDGRGPFLTLRRCEGERPSCVERSFYVGVAGITRVCLSSECALLAAM